MGLSAAEAPTSPGGAQWLDIRVIYVRVSAPAVSYAEAPEKLVFQCGPRDLRSEMEMNGARIPPSELACLTLRLDRMDEGDSEAMYVSTDKLRLSCGMPFSVFHKDEQLACGLISCRDSLAESQVSPTSPLDWSVTGGSEPSRPDELNNSIEGGRSGVEWGMKCSCTVSPSWSGFTIKSIQDLTAAQPVQPSLEVCVVGKCSGASIMLTDQVQLLPRKRGQWKGGLDAIPETESSGRGLVLAGQLLPGHFAAEEDEREIMRLDEHEHLRRDPSGPRQGQFLEGLWPSQTSLDQLYGDEENGEMTWFNAGVRVGVGIGLGMCIGMGIGVGLFVKTYQATTRPFRGARFL